MLGSNPGRLPVLIALVAALLTAPVLTFSTQLVHAQQDKEISLDHGTGTITCGPSFDYVHDANIDFFARENDGRVSGHLIIETVEKFPDEIFGRITGIHISGEKDFTLTATINQDIIPCKLGSGPVQYILTGECGRGVTQLTSTGSALSGEFFSPQVVCNFKDPIQRGSFTVSQTATSSNLPKAVPGFAAGGHQITIEVAANYEYNTATEVLTIDQDSLKGQLWIDKGTSRAKSFPLNDVTALSVSPDFKTATYKAKIKFGGTMIVGTITGTSTFDPAIDFEHAKDQSAKTNKMTLELSIAKVKLEVKRALSGAIDFT